MSSFIYLAGSLNLQLHLSESESAAFLLLLFLHNTVQMSVRLLEEGGQSFYPQVGLSLISADGGSRVKINPHNC